MECDELCSNKSPYRVGCDDIPYGKEDIIVANISLQYPISETGVGHYSVGMYRAKYGRRDVEVVIIKNQDQHQLTLATGASVCNSSLVPKSLKVLGYWMCNETKESVIVTEPSNGEKWMRYFSRILLHETDKSKVATAISDVVREILRMNLISEVIHRDLLNLNNIVFNNDEITFRNFHSSAKFPGPAKRILNLAVSGSSFDTHQIFIDLETFFIALDALAEDLAGSDYEFSIDPSYINQVISDNELANIPGLIRAVLMVKHKNDVNDLIDKVSLHIGQLFHKITKGETVSDDRKEAINKILDKTYKKARNINKPAKDYQKMAVKHMMYNDGLIVAFDVGTGKTLTATMTVFAIDELAKEENRDPLQIYIITPASLVDNMKDTMKEYGLPINSERYHFMTVQKFGKDFKDGLIDCSNILLVIDEAHNLRKDYRGEFNPMAKINAGKATQAESAIKCSGRAWKTVLLTATPMYNQPYDIVNLLAMVKHRYEPLGSYAWRDIILGHNIKNTFECTIIYQESNKEDFPARITKVVPVEMTDEYYQKYRELEMRVKSKIKSKGARKAPENKEKVESEANSFNIKLKKATNNLTPYLKVDYVKKIIEKREKTVIFSALVSAGIDLIKKYMNDNGMGDDYLVVSGEINKKKRSQIVKQFNDPNGPFVMLITKAGGEGLDLKGVRHVIILEQGWNDATNEQAIGRGIRYKSHAHLPEKDRNTTVHYLVMTKPKAVREKLEAFYDMRKRAPTSKEESPYSADEYFMQITKYKKEQIDRLTELVKAVDIKSIGCGNTPKE